MTVLALRMKSVFRLGRLRVGSVTAPTSDRVARVMTGRTVRERLVGLVIESHSPDFWGEGDFARSIGCKKGCSAAEGKQYDD